MLKCVKSFCDIDVVYSKDLNVYLFLYDNFISNFLIFFISGAHTLLMVMVCVLNNLWFVIILRGGYFQ